MSLKPASEYSPKTLTLTDIAELGLWYDDPYGDGIRLDYVRNPGPARQAALALVYKGQYDLFGEQLIRAHYEAKVRNMFNRKGRLYADVARNI